VAKKKAKKKKVTGRPTRYRSEYNEQAFKLCLLGAKDEDLAGFFGVTVTTIANWKNRYPRFLDSLKAGKRGADIEIAHSLYRKGCGYEYTEQQAVKLKTVLYSKGKRVKEEEHVEVVEVARAIPPDTVACIFWLKNRDKENWRDKQDHEHTGPDGGPIPAQINVRLVRADEPGDG
jgi:hypothetical protein